MDAEDEENCEKCDCLKVLNLEKSAPSASVKEKYLKLAYSCHPRRVQTSEAGKEFAAMTEACYYILTHPTCSNCWTETCKECNANSELCIDYAHAYEDHVLNGDTYEGNYHELLFFSVLEEKVRKHRFMPKKKKKTKQEILSEEDEKLFEFFDHLVQEQKSERGCEVCRRNKKQKSDVDRKDEKMDESSSEEASKYTTADESGRSEKEGSSEMKMNQVDEDMDESVDDKEMNEDHPESEYSPGCHSPTDESRSCEKGDMSDLTEQSTTASDLSSEMNKSGNSQTKSKKQCRKEAEAKRKMEMQEVKEELLKKFKLDDCGKKEKKCPIIIPKEIIPKNVKKEIERQHKEAERRRRDHERRLRAEEAKEKKMEKKEKKKARRKYTEMKPETDGRNANESVSGSSLSTETTSYDTTFSSFSTSHSSEQLTSFSSSDNSGIEKTPASSKKADSSFLTKHLEAYKELMKEQPKRHTTQQIQEERKRIRNAALLRQNDELKKIRMDDSVSMANGSTDGSKREEYLRRLRDRERQINIEEEEDIKKSRSSKPTRKSKNKIVLPVKVNFTERQTVDSREKRGISPPSLHRPSDVWSRSFSLIPEMPQPPQPHQSGPTWAQKLKESSHDITFAPSEMKEKVTKLFPTCREEEDAMLLKALELSKDTYAAEGVWRDAEEDVLSEDSATAEDMDEDTQEIGEVTAHLTYQQPPPQQNTGSGTSVEQGNAQEQLGSSYTSQTTLPEPLIPLSVNTLPRNRQWTEAEHISSFKKFPSSYANSAGHEVADRIEKSITACEIPPSSIICSSGLSSADHQMPLTVGPCKNANGSRPVVSKICNPPSKYHYGPQPGNLPSQSDGKKRISQTFDQSPAFQYSSVPPPNHNPCFQSQCHREFENNCLPHPQESVSFQMHHLPPSLLAGSPYYPAQRCPPPLPHCYPQSMSSLPYIQPLIPLPQARLGASAYDVPPPSASRPMLPWCPQSHRKYEDVGFTVPPPIGPRPSLSSFTVPSLIPSSLVPCMPCMPGNLQFNSDKITGVKDLQIPPVTLQKSVSRNGVENPFMMFSVSNNIARESSEPNPYSQVNVSVCTNPCNEPQVRSREEIVKTAKSASSSAVPHQLGDVSLSHGNADGAATTVKTEDALSDALCRSGQGGGILPPSDKGNLSTPKKTELKKDGQSKVSRYALRQDHTPENWYDDLSSDDEDDKNSQNISKEKIVEGSSKMFDTDDIYSSTPYPIIFKKATGELRVEDNREKKRDGLSKQQLFTAEDSEVPGIDCKINIDSGCKLNGTASDDELLSIWDYVPQEGPPPEIIPKDLTDAKRLQSKELQRPKEEPKASVASGRIHQMVPRVPQKKPEVDLISKGDRERYVHGTHSNKEDTHLRQDCNSEVKSLSAMFSHVNLQGHTGDAKDMSKTKPMTHTEKKPEVAHLKAASAAVISGGDALRKTAEDMYPNPSCCLPAGLPENQIVPYLMYLKESQELENGDRTLERDKYDAASGNASQQNVYKRESEVKPKIKGMQVPESCSGLASENVRADQLREQALAGTSLTSSKPMGTERFHKPSLLGTDPCRFQRPQQIDSASGQNLSSSTLGTYGNVLGGGMSVSASGFSSDTATPGVLSSTSLATNSDLVMLALSLQQQQQQLLYLMTCEQQARMMMLTAAAQGSTAEAALSQGLPAGSGGGGGLSVQGLCMGASNNGNRNLVHESSLADAQELTDEQIKAILSKIPSENGKRSRAEAKSNVVLPGATQNKHPYNEINLLHSHKTKPLREAKELPEEELNKILKQLDHLSCGLDNSSNSKNTKTTSDSGDGFDVGAACLNDEQLHAILKKIPPTPEEEENWSDGIECSPSKYSSCTQPVSQSSKPNPGHSSFGTASTQPLKSNPGYLGNGPGQYVQTSRINTSKAPPLMCTNMAPVMHTSKALPVMRDGDSKSRLTDSGLHNMLQRIPNERSKPIMEVGKPLRFGSSLQDQREEKLCMPLRKPTSAARYQHQVTDPQPQCPRGRHQSDVKNLSQNAEQASCVSSVSAANNKVLAKGSLSSGSRSSNPATSKKPDNPFALARAAFAGLRTAPRPTPSSTSKVGKIGVTTEAGNRQ